MSDFSYEIGDLKQIAYTFAQTVCALARIEGMKAANADRANRGELMAYGDADFASVPEEEGITHNQVLARWAR